MGNSRRDASGGESVLEFNRLIGQSSFGAEGARMLGERPEQPDMGAASLASIPPDLAHRFRLVRELPAGGESDVLIVTDTAGTQLVLKLYRAGVIPSPDTWAVLHAIDSPHVARLVDWGDAGGRAFEVMEYVEVGTLRDLIDGPRDDLDFEAIVDIVRQVAAGLKALHDARIIHRDLKPANILVRSWHPPELALADFGVSRYMENTTAFSAAGHTLAYTAPETFAGHVSSARDWWSLGMIVREIVTGKPPFMGMSPEVVMLTLASRSVDCLEVTDPRLRLLCRGLLTRDPAARWGAVDVARWLDGESPAAHEDSPGQHISDSAIRCPYRGLAPYDEHDAEVFCGRDQTIASLLDAVAGQIDQDSLMIVVGPSGAGKSSLLRAGLIPRISRGELAPGSSGWPRVLMTPGSSPLDELAVRLAPFAKTSKEWLRQVLDRRPGEAAHALRLAMGSGTERPGESQEPNAQRRLILIVDQFEEIFTLAAATERARFIEVLKLLAKPDGHPRASAAMVVLGLRADFYSDCTAYPDLAKALQSAAFLVTPMTESDIRAAITQPAARIGLAIEPGLIDVVVRDAGLASPQSERGAGVLPLLSHAMLATWQYRTGSALTLAAYQAAGGLIDSIARTADMTYDRLSVTQQHAARALLSRMVTVGPDGRTMRRTLDRAEYTWLTADDDMTVAMEAMTEARLLVIQQDAVEITHEALLHAWPRFREWLAEDAARFQLIGQLAQSTRAWAEDGRDPAYLFRDARLATVLASLDDDRDIAATERDFLATSQRLQRRRALLRRSMVLALVMLVVISLAAAIVALGQASTAAEQRDIVMSQQLASESQTVSDPNVSALLAVAAWRFAPTSQASNSLVAAFIRRNVTTLTGAASSVASLAFSPDGRILAIADSGGTVQLWNVAMSRKIARLNVTAAGLTQVAYNPDGKLLATAGSDGIVRLWDVEIGQRPVLIGPPLTVGTGTTWVAFSPDGEILATAGLGRSVKLWNLTAGKPRSLRTLPASSGASSVTFSPDGRTLAAVSRAGGVGLWNAATGRQISAIASSALGGRTGSIAFSPDGRILAGGSAAATVRLWDATTGRQIGAFQTGNGRTQVAFSPDGRTLATASTDGTVRLWDMATKRQIGSPLTADGISQAAFSPDGKILITASVGATPIVQLWRLATTTSATRLIRAICASVGRNLTRKQWVQYIPDIPYQPSCRA